MTRIREHLRKVAALALLALAIQLAAGSGHVHPLAGDGSEPAGFAGTVAADRHEGQPDNHSDEGCALCAVLSLALHSILPALPQLDLPVQVRAEIPATPFALFRETRTAHFHARAPPRT
ncbi:MAG: hypothetical protein AB7K35_09590 [Pseudorhodoplanes sp.]